MREKSRVTSALRVAFVVTLSACVLYNSHVDAAVADVWALLRQSDWFRNDSAEPLAVVAAFAVCNLGWWLLDTRVTWARHLLLRPIHAKEMGHWSWEGGHRLKGETLWYLSTLLIYDRFNPRRILPEAAPTLGRLAADVITTLLLYDALFFCVHVTYHKVPFLYRIIHAKHHTKAVMRACEAVRVSAIEQALDVTCSILALRVVGGHPLSRMVYNIVIVYLITELHCGYDLPWMLANVVPFGLWTGSRVHEYHHAVGRSHFQKFGTHLDWLCGLLPKDPNAVSNFYRSQQNERHQ